MSEIHIPANFKPRPYQLELFQALDGGTRRALLRWSRRSGKDKTCYSYMVKEMCKNPGIYYYFFPTYQQGRKALWETVDKGFKVLDHLPKEMIKRINNQEMLIELINGSIFRIIGTDNIDSVVGTNPVGCVFSEFALQDPKAWQYIAPILAQNGGWAIFNSTPRGHNHMYDLEMNIQHDPDWYVSTLQCLWPDREHYFPVTSLKNIDADRQAGIPEDAIEQEYGVSYSANIQGAIYSEHLKKCRLEGRIGPFAYNNNYPVFTFWDLGYNDPTSIWFVQYIGNKIIFIDYYEEAKQEIPELAEMLSRKPYKYAVHYLPHDAEQKYGLIVTKKDLLEQALKAYNVGDTVIVVPKLPVNDGISAVQARFASYYFNSGLCGKAVDMLGRYHKRYDDKRRVFVNEPVHDWTSHCADAIRTEALAAESDYSVESVDVQNGIKVISGYDPFN